MRPVAVRHSLSAAAAASVPRFPAEAFLAYRSVTNLGFREPFMLEPDKPLCFVLMPFGSKPDGSGRTVNFDAVYEEFIGPAIREAGLEPLRADEEMTGGIIHKPMYERLILCEYAVADLTTANANVFYELGLRHGIREWSTVCVFAEGRGQLPFDVATFRALPYHLGDDGKPTDGDADQKALSAILAAATKGQADSPVFQLVQGFPDIDRLKTDVFRDQVRLSDEFKKRLQLARGEGLDGVKAVEQDLDDISRVDSGVVIDLYLSYRAVKGWEEMIALVERMSPPLAATVMVREQLALALNRAGRGEEAEQILLRLIDERGPSSETFGILGRVYKDQWQAAGESGKKAAARGWQRKAVEAYLTGFEADWRDAYPGINAVTLMALSEPPDARAEQLIPVVRYAVQRRVEAGRPDYWDYATLLELAVLARDQDRAYDALVDAAPLSTESWMAESTAGNLRLIREARESRGEAVDWITEIEAELSDVGERGKGQ